jgi:hypothetical protein
MTHWRVTVTGSTPAGDIWVTGFDLFRSSGGDTAGALTAWTTAWELGWNGTGASDDIKSLVNVDWVGTQLTATQIGLDNKNVDQAIATVSLPGTSTDDSMPAETCPVLSLRTANASKAGRGRRYWPALADTNQDADGRMLTAAQTQLANAGQNIVQSLNGASYQVVVWHRFAGFGDPVTAVDVADAFRSQRRRQNRQVVTRVRMSV